ncbi:hypothetical protein N9N67_01635 [Bacteriovoracaceae bacterium]|nr:hypothetical protein [Bacteriovoracaceae bacterium]
MKVPGSGRKKGTPNKKTKNLEEIVEALNYNPFETLLHIANGKEEATNGKEISLEVQFKALKEVCTYLYPKRKQISVEYSKDSIEDVILKAKTLKKAKIK